MSEEWRLIPGWECFYEISSLGRVRTLIARRRSWAGRFLARRKDNYGYWCVKLSANGVTKNKRIARLLSAAFISDFCDGKCVDHIDGDRGNDRLENLRMATHQQNSRNMKMHKDNALGFKGIDRLPSGNFRAKIKVGDQRINLGIFQSAVEAANAYRFASKKYHGEFGRDK